MGAGTQDEHYIQDAGELYWVYKLQEHLETNNTAIKNDSHIKKEEFLKYCSDRNITTKFDKSIYKKNVDNVIQLFLSSLLTKFKDQKMNIINIEVDARNDSLKGDFAITFLDKPNISVSLKNYKSGFNRIQLCSGTWISFLNRFILTKAKGPGMFIDIDGNKFSGSNISKRDECYKELGYSNLIEPMNRLDEINKIVKQKYVYDKETEFFNESVKKMWKQDCSKYGCEGANIVKTCLDYIPKNKLLELLLNMTNLDSKEELLLIGKNQMLCSLFNTDYNNMLNRAKNSQLSLNVKNQSLWFHLNDTNGSILSIDVPFTLQKNGAWFLEKEYKHMDYYHPKEEITLKYSQRRPKKSKEIATSTNMWFNLTKITRNLTKILP